MKSLISASASLLLASLGGAPLAAAQTSPLPPRPAICQSLARLPAAPWSGPQAKLPPGRTYDPPAAPARMEPDFDPYPTGYGLYDGSNG